MTKAVQCNMHAGLSATVDAVAVMEARRIEKRQREFPPEHWIRDQGSDARADRVAASHAREHVGIRDSGQRAGQRIVVGDERLEAGPASEPFVTSPKQFAELIRGDGVRWAAVIKKAQVKAQ